MLFGSDNQRPQHGPFCVSQNTFYGTTIQYFHVELTFVEANSGEVSDEKFVRP